MTPAITLLKTTLAAAEPGRTSPLLGKTIVDRSTQPVTLVVLPNIDGDWNASDAGLILNRPEHALEPVQANIPECTVFKTKLEVNGLAGELQIQEPMVMGRASKDPPKLYRTVSAETATAEGMVVGAAGVLVRCTEEPEYGIRLFLRVLDSLRPRGQVQARCTRYRHDQAFVYVGFKATSATLLRADERGRRIAPATSQARQDAETAIRFIRGIQTHQARSAFLVLD